MAALPTSVKSTLLILTLLMVQFALVHAGNRLWEPPLGDIHSNWVVINPGPDSNIWPNKEIKYCFKTKQQEKDMEHWVLAGMELWHASGLSHNYKMRKANDAVCSRRRREVVMIENDPTQMVSSAGVITPEPGVPGPYGNWHINVDGLGSIAANFAHEIGHVWGLSHEHQNPAFWGNMNDERLFGFDCTQLNDFKEKSKGLSWEEIWGDQGICTSSTSANEHQFSASQFLPLPWEFLLQGYGRYAHDSDVDWSSIMIYPSRITGQRVLWRRNGNQDIKQNTSPSARDVVGMKYLYEIRPEYPRLLLLNDPRSENFTKFKKYVPGCPYQPEP